VTSLLSKKGSSWQKKRLGYHNDSVINISSPRLSTALDMAKEEAWVWGMAGIKDLAQLSGQSAPGEV
jgi:hypothetical protein